MIYLVFFIISSVVSSSLWAMDDAYQIAPDLILSGQREVTFEGQLENIQQDIQKLGKQINVLYSSPCLPKASLMLDVAMKSYNDLAIRIDDIRKQIKSGELGEQISQSYSGSYLKKCTNLEEQLKTLGGMWDELDKKIK